MRLGAVLVVAMVVVALTGVVVLADSDDNRPKIDEENVSPGESVTGAVVAGEADVATEIDVRAFGHRLQAADNASARAQLIADRLARNDETLDTLENRAAELDAELAAGNISHGQYLAEMVRIAAGSNAVELTTARSAQAAEGLGEELRRHGVAKADIEAVQERAKGQSPFGNESVPGLSDDREPGPPVNVSDVGPPEDDRPSNEAGRPDR